MKKFLIAVAIMFVLNILITGLLQSQIKIMGNQIGTKETLNSAYHTRHAYLLRERQELMRRDRIVSYAQQNLGMKLLKPDEIAGGQYLKEIVEETSRNNNVVYSFIDFITPSMNAFEGRR
ncbi:MAG: hypothetical protein FWG98_04805 [Candidatus Cloacimonetes bacterium]|nr:hypothetical protein [Candidatus Cloacimonadota bacterium]